MDLAGVIAGWHAGCDLGWEEPSKGLPIALSVVIVRPCVESAGQHTPFIDLPLTERECELP
jgi:hypothetical protein